MGTPCSGGDLKRLKPEQALAVIEAAAVTAFLSVMPLGIYLWSLGLRIARSRQFPPPGMKVIRDTPLTIGGPAMLRGKLLVFLALLLIILGLSGAVYAHMALSGLAGVRHVGQVL